jgi:glycosyltransferase involved in cell wall biosynthesis
MSTTTDAPPHHHEFQAQAPDVEIVVPVFNEERDLERSVRRLHAYVEARLPFSARITIADNASTDATGALADRLAGELTGVRVLHLPARGRGRALRAAWSASDATVLAYMDVDLSTDLDALLPLVAPLVSGHSDVSIGTRLARGSRVVRGPKREVISRGYNLILRAALGARFSDAQCGFKAIRADRARDLLRSWRTRAGSSTRSCSCWRSAPACASTRCRWTGWTIRTAGSTSSGRRSRT